MAQFTHYPTSVVYGLSFKSLRSLPPSDILGLSTGFDETGHTIWRGALDFISLLKGEEGWLWKGTPELNEKTLSSLFSGQTVLELGAGVGLSGLVLSLHCPQLSSLTLSDGDAKTVDLCAHNVASNKTDSPPPFPIDVKRITWPSQNCTKEEQHDVTLATDVIYDLSILNPLFSTVKSHALKRFVLSHVPRSNVDNRRAIGTEEQIREKILEAGKDHGVEYVGEWRREGVEGSVMVFDIIQEE